MGGIHEGHRARMKQKLLDNGERSLADHEVLEVLLVSDENVQDIAETLMISRAALYRHIASLNEKTGTKSRIGLVQFYYRYHRRNGG